MLSLVHTITSLPLLLVMDNVVLVFIAAFVWHLIADTLLHWNFYPNRAGDYPFIPALLDVCAGLLVAWFLVGPAMASPLVLAAIAGGNAPDVLHALWDQIPRSGRRRLPGLVQRWFVFHEKLQLETFDVLAGLVIQAVLVAAAIVLLTFGSFAA